MMGEGHRLDGYDRLEMLRRAHEARKKLRSMAEEDYIEVIYEVEKVFGYARPSDIAAILGVKASSVTDMLKKLEKKNYVVYEKYRFVRLTEKGKTIARELSRKHEFLMEFLMSLGVDKDRANIEAELLEHFLSSETIEKLRKFYMTCLSSGSKG